jgi:hypothetical protein
VGKKKRVEGWIGLLRKISTKKAGLSVFRRGRLVEGSHDETWRPEELFKEAGSYPYKSIVGELTVVGFNVSHTKDGIDWGGHDYFILNELKKVFTDPEMHFIHQTNLWRRKDSFKNISPDAHRKNLKDVADELDQKCPDAMTAIHTPQVPSPELSSFLESGTDVEKSHAETLADATSCFSFVDAEKNRIWKIRLSLVNKPSDRNWYSYSIEESPEQEENLEVTVNAAHCFSEAYMNESIHVEHVLFRLVAIMVISEHLTRGQGQGTGVTLFRQNLNELLRRLSNEETT